MTTIEQRATPKNSGAGGLIAVGVLLLWLALPLIYLTSARWSLWGDPDTSDRAAFERLMAAEDVAAGERDAAYDLLFKAVVVVTAMAIAQAFASPLAVAPAVLAAGGIVVAAHSITVPDADRPLRFLAITVVPWAFVLAGAVTRLRSRPG